MYEFWHELLQGEEESPTIRFKGKTDRYSWKQNTETIEVSGSISARAKRQRNGTDSSPLVFSRMAEPRDPYVRFSNTDNLRPDELYFHL